MHCFFYKLDGRPEMSLQYTGPGRSFFGQNEAHIDRDMVEGEVIKFHVGHGVYRDYTVMACDGKMALLQEALWRGESSAVQAQ